MKLSAVADATASTTLALPVALPSQDLVMAAAPTSSSSSSSTFTAATTASSRTHGHPAKRQKL